jgi:hypothetical protein
MSCNRFVQIWYSPLFNTNELLKESTGRLFKIKQVLHSSVEKFQDVYKPNQEISLDEAMVPWKGGLRILTYNPGKLVKYGLLVRIDSESTTSYTENLEINMVESKKN